jgi:hypothetical protein
MSVARERRRWHRLAAAFPDLTEMGVVDLGGSLDVWRRAPLRPAHLHLVTRQPVRGDVPDWVVVSVADVCEPPPWPGGPGGGRRGCGRADLVLADGVLDDLGAAERRRCAAVVAGLADRHWIRTRRRGVPAPVTRGELAALFPTSAIVPEREWGLTRALVAVCRG